MPATDAARSIPGKPKFWTKQYFPEHTKELRQWFLGLFHPYDYILKPLWGGEWKTAPEGWQLKPSEIFKAVSGHPLIKNFYGTRSGADTYFGALDIDATSPYHTKENLDRIIKLLERAGITEFRLYRSSYSGGWHLYFFFEKSVPSRELHGALEKLLKSDGFQIAPGVLEIFPNPGSAGSMGYGFRLPLQIGFAWLDIDTLEVEQERSNEYLRLTHAEKLSDDAAIESMDSFADLFCMTPLEALSAFRSDYDDFSNTYYQYLNFIQYVSQLKKQQDRILTVLKADIPSARKSALAAARAQKFIGDVAEDDLILVIETFGYVPPNMNVTDWVKGRNYAVTGLTGEAQRSYCTFCLSHYFFFGDPGKSIEALGYAYEAERDALVAEILDRKHNGFSKEINRGLKDPRENVRRQAFWRPASKRGAAATQSMAKPITDPTVQLIRLRANNKRRMAGRNKIHEAVEALLEEGIQISLESIHRMSAKLHEKAVAISTIRRHPDLWKTKQDEQYEDLFAGLSGDLNSVCGEAASKTASPAQAQIFLPAGLLACRQIASEIVMRSERLERAQQKEHASDTASEALKWKESVLRNLPVSISDLDIKALRSLSNRLAVSLMTSPDDQHQAWLLEIQKNVRDELVKQTSVFQLSIVKALQEPLDFDDLFDLDDSMAEPDSA